MELIIWEEIVNGWSVKCFKPLTFFTKSFILSLSGFWIRLCILDDFDRIPDTIFTVKIFFLLWIGFVKITPLCIILYPRFEGHIVWRFTLVTLFECLRFVYFLGFGSIFFTGCFCIRRIIAENSTYFVKNFCWVFF